MPVSHKEAFFYGMSVCNWGTWQVSSMAGILLARQIPDNWGLTFVGTLALIGMLLPLMLALPGALTVATASAVAVAAHSLP